jgi:hypothetical protein
VQGGNMLILAIFMIMFITFIFINLTNTSVRILAQAQDKAAQQYLSLEEARIVQALRKGYYDAYWDRRIAGQPFDNAAATSAFSNAVVMLGMPPATTPDNFDLPSTLYGKINVKLTLGGGFGVFTPGAGQFADTAGDARLAGTWLQGMPARIHPLPVNIALRTELGLVGTNAITRTVTRTILFCEVPQKAMALIAEDGLTYGGGSALNIFGKARVVGSPAATLDITGGDLVVDNAGTLSQSGTMLSDLDRYDTEIANQNQYTSDTDQVRNASIQAILDPVRPVPAEHMCREGMDNPNHTLSAAQKAVYRQTQPFYKVDPGSRFMLTGSWGTGYTTFTYADGGSYNPPLNVDADPLTSSGPSSPFGDLQLVTGVGTVIPVNIALLPGYVNNGNVKVFLSAADLGTENNDNPTYSASFLIQSLGRLEPGGAGTSLNSITIISPNRIIFEGSFNRDDTGLPAYTPVPATIIADRVQFGLVNDNAVVKFQGTVRGKSTTHIEDILRGNSAQGPRTSTTATIDISRYYTADQLRTLSEFDSGGEMFYATIVQQR